MSPELAEVTFAFNHDGRVPSTWSTCHPSLKLVQVKYPHITKFKRLPKQWSECIFLSVDVTAVWPVGLTLPLWFMFTLTTMCDLSVTTGSSSAAIATSSAAIATSSLPFIYAYYTRNWGAVLAVFGFKLILVRQWGFIFPFQFSLGSAVAWRESSFDSSFIYLFF